MLSLTLAAALAVPPWVTETAPKPPTKEFVVVGSGAPADLVLVQPKKPTAFTVKGPGKATVTLVGLGARKGKKAQPPGFVRIRLDQGIPEKVDLPENPVFSVQGKANLAAMTPFAKTLDLTAGEHQIVIMAIGGRVGVAVRIDVTTTGAPETPGPVVATGGETPVESLPTGTNTSGVGGAEPAPAPSAEPPAATPLASEPALAAGSDEPEPDLAAAPTQVAEPAPIGTEGYTFVGSPPPLTTILGPQGADKFLAVSINDGLVLEAIGPGVMLFDIHAHRAEATPESLRPVIIGVMIDDVLLQTLSVDQPAAKDLKVEGATYTPSLRVTLRVPIEPGSHRVRLSLSDAAVLGASIKPRFQTLSAADEPGLLSAEAARAKDLRAYAPAVEVYGAAGVGPLVSAFVPTSANRAGAMVLADANLQIPVAGPRLAIGLWAGIGRTDHSQPFADDRRTSGESRAYLSHTLLPAFVELRWSAPLTVPFGLETGVGGGVLVAMTEMRAAGATSQADTKVVAAVTAQATGFYEMGPGALMVRLQFIASQPANTEVVRHYDYGGALLSLGYRFTFGDSIGG